MKKINKKRDNVILFNRGINKLERQIEAILFAADEPLDIETIEKRVQSTKNIQKGMDINSIIIVPRYLILTDN